MRKGFSLITAIIFMVLIATLSMFALNISSLTSKQTTDVFLREQAELLAQSATEIAILNLLRMNFSTNCPLNLPNRNIVNTLFPNNATPMFRVTVTLERLFGTFGACNQPSAANPALNHAASAGTVILDVVVTQANANMPPIRIHRRTIQKL